MIEEIPSINIGGREISASKPPFVIAEISANHNGVLENALQLIKKAKVAGADAIKLQTYKAETLTLPSNKPDFQITSGLWKGQSLFELYDKAHMPWEWHKPIFELCLDIGIIAFSSPFDTTAVDLLEDYNVPAYKIASFEAIDLPLIKYVAATKKPMIISTGMANEQEIEEALDAAYTGGCSQVALLHCVSAYPAEPGDYNLRTLSEMKKKFGTVVGLSDHTIDNITAYSSIALGASIIEKHFTLDRNGGGPDDSFSLEPADLKELCQNCNVAWKALGKPSFEQHSSEKGNVKFRRSIYVISDLKAGDTITEEDIAIVRPGYGVKPKYYDKVIGAKLTQNVSKHTAFSWDMIDV